MSLLIGPVPAIIIINLHHERNSVAVEHVVRGTFLRLRRLPETFGPAVIGASVVPGEPGRARHILRVGFGAGVHVIGGVLLGLVGRREFTIGLGGEVVTNPVRETSLLECLQQVVSEVKVKEFRLNRLGSPKFVAKVNWNTSVRVLSKNVF